MKTKLFPALLSFNSKLILPLSFLSENRFDFRRVKQKHIVEFDFDVCMRVMRLLWQTKMT